jgi:hypothetical protein
MGIMTSHKISYLYPPILNSTRHCLVIVTWLPFCNHETLYEVGCAVISSSNLSTISVDTKLSVFPLSIITLHTISLVLQAVLNRLFLCTGFSTSSSSFKRTFFIIKYLPYSTPFVLAYLQIEGRVCLFFIDGKINTTRVYLFTNDSNIGNATMMAWKEQKCKLEEEEQQ